MDWTVLENFDSQSEARVVESFLKAQGLDVQLLDTFSQTFLPARALGPGSGMRLLVHKQDEPRARQLLQEVQSSSRLHLVHDVQETPNPPFERSSNRRVIFFLLALVALLVCLAGRML